MGRAAASESRLLEASALRFMTGPDGNRIRLRRWPGSMDEESAAVRSAMNSTLDHSLIICQEAAACVHDVSLFGS
jgi:hypothetical protein